MQWDADGLTLTGLVAGSQQAAYGTAATFHKGQRGIQLDYGICTCPVQANCKHVAALLLTADAMRAEASLGSGAGDKPVPEKWERQLAAILPCEPEEAAHRGRAHPAPPGQVVTKLMPMALQFELFTEPANPYSRYRAAALVQEEDPAHVELRVRLVALNDAGKWVRGNLTWDKLGYDHYSHGLNPAHWNWMVVFHALARAGTPSYANTGRWINVEKFNSALLWQLLGQARQVGIQFVGSRKAVTIAVHEEAVVGLDVLAQADGALRLLPRAESDGVALDPAAVGMVGSPAHGLFWWDSGKGNEPSLQKVLAKSNISLAPVSHAVSNTVHALVDGRTAVEIPPSGRERFMGSYYPLLRQGLVSTGELVSSDGSADLPELKDPDLVVTAVHTPAPKDAGDNKLGRKSKGGATQLQGGPGLELHWHWEYLVDGVVARRPMVADHSGYRDAAFETRLLAEVSALLEPFPAAVQEPFPHAPSLYPGSNAPVRLKDVAAARFSTEALPALAILEHVRVDTSGIAPDYTELTATPQIGISTTGTDNRDWFDLGVTVKIDGTEAPFDQLFRALADGEEHLMLPNGHYFSLDQAEFQQLRTLIEEARSLQEPGESLKISRYQAGLWDELAELAATSEQAEAWRTQVSGLLELSGVEPVPVPASLQASLRPYQHEGFNWLVFLHENGLGGVLADDMGLGKTLQTLALICHAQAMAGADTKAPPFLVVAPTSVVPNWAAEAARFAPSLRTTAVTDTLTRSKTEPAELVAGADVVVVSYTLFRLDYDAYARQEWSGLILDEAQFVKNPATHASRNARMFPAPFKLAITGTPMENNLMELWSLFAITAPGLFPSSKNFADYYSKPVEKEGDADKLKQLRRRIRPLIMRRTKDAVAKDLPPKQEQVLELELAPRHRTIYQRHLQRERQKVLGMLGDMDKNRFAIFKSLTTLRMLSLDASLVDKKYANAPSSKLDVLFEQLEDVVAEGHRALIFSQFTSFLGKAAERLDAAGIDYAYRDGKTRKRGDVIEKFKSGTAPVFLISLKAGGFGLNLTEADYCFLLDPWWNPATENQAVDRTHRIGQKKNVMVYRLVAKDTIEEKVMALKEKKAKLFSAVMDDDAMFSSALSAEDVRGLFDA